MANIVKEVQVNAFTKGLITEANPLTFPENASLDEENFNLELNGSRSRRLGVDYESGYAFKDTGLSGTVMQSSLISFHYWPFPDGSTTVSLGVVRVDNRLFFIDLLHSSPSSLAALKNQGNFVTIDAGTSEIQTSVINGIFVLTPGKTTGYPYALTYNKTTDVVTSSQIAIKVRDFFGVYENIAADYRPTDATISDIHNYNLQNQGWNNLIQTSCGAGVSAIQCTKNVANPRNGSYSFPSNADKWELGKSANAASATYEVYDPLYLFKNSIDNASVGRGHFILDYRTRGADRLTKAVGVVTIPVDAETNYVSTVASYAGRAFYAGVISSVTGADNNSPNYTGYVFFSQLAKNKDNLALCYQENDPTSTDISDIVDTDGGVIHIPEASRIYKLLAYNTSLLVFAENGLWEITGENGVFKATSYQVNKISTIGTESPNSIVEAGGSVLYWTNSGIYAVASDPSSGRMGVQNVSLTTIQTYYNTIPSLSKRYAKGIYDERSSVVRWLFSDDATQTETNYPNKFNMALNLSVALNAFYVYRIGSIATTGPYVSDLIKIPNYAATVVSTGVVVGVDVVQASGVDVNILANNSTPRSAQFGVLTIKDGTYTISKFSSTRFRDWYTENTVGVNYSSYLVTGYNIFGDISHTKQVPYIVFYFDRTEQNFILSGTDLVLDYPSSCLVQAQWDWCNSANSGKWGTQFQAYRLLRNYIPAGPEVFDYGDRVIITKSKLRGSGRSLSLKIQSEENKDMKLLGWSMDISGKPKV